MPSRSGERLLTSEKTGHFLEGKVNPGGGISVKCREDVYCVCVSVCLSVCVCVCVCVVLNMRVCWWVDMMYACVDMFVL